MFRSLQRFEFSHATRKNSYKELLYKGYRILTCTPSFAFMVKIELCLMALVLAPASPQSSIASNLCSILIVVYAVEVRAYCWPWTMQHSVYCRNSVQSSFNTMKAQLTDEVFLQNLWFHIVINLSFFRPVTFHIGYLNSLRPQSA